MSKSPQVRIAVSVDWEGRDLAPENLDAFSNFREAHSDVPLTHFLNAAYFCKPDAIPVEIAASINSVVLDSDETGLHIHPWKSFVEAAGVDFRSGPTVWGVERPERKNWPDPGHDVSVEAYMVDEFQILVAYSKQVLAQNGFELSNSFRAGAWLAGPRVREAIRREGFLIDSSATDTKWHTKISQFALPAMIRDIWPDVTSETQPFFISTPAGQLLEMPDTGALADYVSAEQMMGHISEAVSRLGDEDIYVHIGFHLETADKYLSRVTEAISLAKSKFGEKLKFETLSQSASQFLDH
ncbi:MAG: hypothetical protein QGF46_00535 [Planctomycetota bacterium]|nr:hypothetical protein [Planctomycetota bacterium]